MRFDTPEDMRNFLTKVQYYKNNDNFCLGSTHTQAGEILKRILEAAQAQKKARQSQ